MSEWIKHVVACFLIIVVAAGEMTLIQRGTLIVYLKDVLLLVVIVSLMHIIIFSLPASAEKEGK